MQAKPGLGPGMWQSYAVENADLVVFLAGIGHRNVNVKALATHEADHGPSTDEQL